MCGIFGYAGNIRGKKASEQAFLLLREIARESEIRGQDSTGFSCKFQDTNLIVSDKMPYRATIFNSASHKFRRLRSRMPELFIGHTRLGTGSSPIINNNNHPFYGDMYHMVHNGVVPSWKDIQKKHDLKMQSETDSEVILRMMEKARLSGKNTLQSVEETFDKVWGNMAVALLDKDQPYIWLFRNDNPINVFSVPAKIFGENMFFFASLSAIFDDAWKTVFGNRYDKDGVGCALLNSNKLYSISPIATDLGKGIGWQKFVVYQTAVKRRFDRSKQYSSTNAVTTTYFHQTHFFSEIIDVDKPQLGLKLSKKSIDAIVSKMEEKNGRQKIKIDGLTPDEFGGLRTLVDDLYKVEMRHFTDQRMKIEDDDDTGDLTDKVDGPKEYKETSAPCESVTSAATPWFPNA